MPGEPSSFDAARAAADPAYFSEFHFGWVPMPYQRDFLDAVLVHRRTRLAWVAGRRVGKTDTMANLALQLAVKRPGIQVVALASVDRQAILLGRRVREMLEGSRFAAHVVLDNVHELRLRFGADERGKSRESSILTQSLSGQVRGQGADVLIVDESAFCKIEDFQNKAMPLLADRPDGILIHTSTVWAEDDHFTKALKEFPALPHGAVFLTPTRMNPRVPASFLEEQRAAMPEADYRREYEAELIPRGGVFKREHLDRCLQDYEVPDLKSLPRLEPKRHHHYYVGVDWGKQQDRSVIAVVEQGTQEQVNKARLALLQVYEPNPDGANHYTGILQDVQRVANHFNARRVVADAGEGGYQAEVLGLALGGRFESFRFTTANRNWLVEHALVLVEQGLVELPMDPDDVRRAFANVQRTPDGGYEHLSRKTKDLFDAVAMALRWVNDGSARRRPLGFAVRAGSREAVGLHMRPRRGRKPTIWDFIE